MAYVRSGLQAFEHRNDIYRGASVTAYVPDASGNPTAVKISLYANATGSTTLANPQTLDGEGKFKQPVYFEAACVLVIASAFASSHTTGVINPPLSDADVTAATTAASAAAVSAAAAASAASAAAAAANSAASDWPIYYRHENLFTTAQ